MARPRQVRSIPAAENSVARRVLTVFYSYAHPDERLREELHKHLSPLWRSSEITTWHDRLIIPGGDFGNEIDRYLTTSDIVLLLISPDFLNSDYCYCREMKRAIDRHEAGEARVIPIILRHCDWQSTPIGRLLALPRDGQPVTAWQLQDEALLDVVKGVRRAVEELSAVPVPSRIHLKRELEVPRTRVRRKGMTRDG